MIKNPTFLLLDEPTSALDSVNEAVIQKALERMMDQNKVLLSPKQSELETYDSHLKIKGMGKCEFYSG